MGTKPRVEIKPVPAELAQAMDEEMAARISGAQTSTESFEAHITNGGKPNLGARRPSSLPPKPAQRPFTLDSD